VKRFFVVSAGKFLLLFFILASAIGGLAQQRTVLEGVYTPAQATRGEAAYRTHCVSCHEGNEPDGPLLTGTDFVDRWREDRLSSLLTHIRTEMPGNQPGSLSENLYVDIVAFLLEANGLPGGSSELSPAVAASVLFVGKDGPKPLPNNSAVLVVGCLAAGPNNSWLLNNTSDPVRTRKVDATNADELKNSAAVALGTQTFRLQNTPDNLGTFAGHKLQVKGVLLRQAANDRINVTLLETLAASCGR
jgi:mono/diheme cytochrome c family protein